MHYIRGRRQLSLLSSDGKGRGATFINATPYRQQLGPLPPVDSFSSTYKLYVQLYGVRLIFCVENYDPEFLYCL